MFKERRAGPPLLRLMYIAETLINPLFIDVTFHGDSEGDGSGHYKSGGVSCLQKFEYHEKRQYFLSLISESETHILYRFITYRVKYFKPVFLEILMIMAYR